MMGAAAHTGATCLSEVTPTSARVSQPAEVVYNGRLEPDSLSLALSTRVTAHESGTCAPSLAPLHVH